MARPAHSRFNLTQRVVGNTLAQVLGRALVVLLGLVTIGLIARHLGVAGYGQYATVFGVLGLLGIAIDLGLYLIIVRVISTHERRPREIVDNVMGLKLALFAAAFLILLLAQTFLPYESVTKTALLVGSLSLLGITLNQALGGVFQAHLRMDLFVAGDVAGRAATLLLTWLFLAQGRGLVAVVWAVVAGYAFNLILTGFLVRRFQRVGVAFSLRVWRWILAEGLPLGMLIVLGTLYLRLDIFLISVFRDASEVGLYGIAAKIAEILGAFSLMFMGAVLPTLARRVGEKDLAGARALAREAYDVLLAIGLGLVVGGVFAAGPIVRLVAGEGFEGSVLALQILLFAVALNFLTIFYGQVMVAWRAQKKLIRATLIAVAISLALNLIMIPRYGYLGAAWVMVAAEAAILVGYVMVTKRETGFRPPEGRTVRLFVALLLLATALWLLRQAPLAVLIAAGAAVYGAALVGLGIIKRERLRELVGVRE